MEGKTQEASALAMCARHASDDTRDQLLAGLQEPFKGDWLFRHVGKAPCEFLRNISREGARTSALGLL
jgi:hypothetical protein